MASLPTFQASMITGPVTAGAWERHQLTNGPTLPSGQQMIFYVLKPTGWDPTKFVYQVLVWEHEDEEGDRAYQGDNSLPQACEADAWFNNPTFRGEYPWLILLPACDQTTNSDAVQNFGGWTPPGDHGPNEDSVALCAQYAIANLGGDPNAVTVGGASLGGIGTWALQLDYNAYNGSFGKVFSAFVPMAGVIERNGFGVGPTAAQYASMVGVPIFAVHGANDTTSQPNWDLDVWGHFGGGATVGGPAGAQAGTSAFRLLFDPGLGHDVWDTYVPLPKGKPIWDWAWAQRATGVQPVPTPAPTPTPIPDVTVLTPGSGGSITDAAGNVWTLPASGAATMNGTAVTGGSGTSKLEVVNGVIWGADATSGQWYSYSPTTGWTAGTPMPTPTPAPTPPPTPVPNPTPAGFFKVSNGKVLRPDGSVFIGGGVNFNQDQMSTVCANAAGAPLTGLFPSTRIVRIANRTYSAPNTYQTFVNQMSALGILCVFEDHTGISAPPYTGAALTTETNWYAAMAAAFKANPYVAFGTFNEPGNGTNLPGIAAQEQAIYDAIRGAGSFALVFLELPSGGNPGLVGINGRGSDGSGPMSPAKMATNYNCVWDLHYYGWVSKFSTDPATVAAALQGSVASASGILACQSIHSADGVMPVFILESGNSTTGSTIDANGALVVETVGQSGTSYAYWAWDAANVPGDLLVSNGQVTVPYGQQVAGLIAATAAANPITPPPTPVPTPPPTPPPTGPTVASVQSELDVITAALAKVRSDVGQL
jgi:cellulase (glycosyl hydrolase family 5)